MRSHHMFMGRIELCWVRPALPYGRMEGGGWFLRLFPWVRRLVSAGGMCQCCVSALLDKQILLLARWYWTTQGVSSVPWLGK